MYSKEGYFGRFGGSFIPEVLQASQQELQVAFDAARQDPAFIEALHDEWQHFSGRPTPLTHCRNLSQALGGAQIFLKREDLNHSGAHKMNNVIGQGLLAKRMGKRRIIAETGAGQHGIASALVAARLGLACTVYMGARDIERQYPNVFWMKQLGADVIAVNSGSKTLRDALDEALRDWSEHFADSHYLIGTSCGCAPYPDMVSYFQSIIGREVREQSQNQFGALPDRLYACVGGGSNASGLFLPFVDDANVSLIGVEAGGHGSAPGEHSIRLSEQLGQEGIAQGFASMFLQNEQGQLQTTHSIAAGLDYVGVSPLIAHLADTERLRMTYARDDAAIDATQRLMRQEGIIPALESAHALAAALADAGEQPQDQTIVVNLSGRGDKDIFNIARALGDEPFTDFLHTYLNNTPAQETSDVTH